MPRATEDTSLRLAWHGGPVRALGPFNWSKAQALWKTARNKERGKPLGTNGLLRLDDGNMVFQLHATDIVTITPNNRYILEANGWYTPLTKTWMEAIVPGLRITNDRWGNWTVKNFKFVDGLTLDSTGAVLGVSLGLRGLEPGEEGSDPITFDSSAQVKVLGFDISGKFYLGDGYIQKSLLDALGRPGRLWEGQVHGRFQGLVHLNSGHDITQDSGDTNFTLSLSSIKLVIHRNTVTGVVLRDMFVELQEIAGVRYAKMWLSSGAYKQLNIMLGSMLEKYLLGQDIAKNDTVIVINNEI